MEQDIGRNDPCWCGSGKKYKKCHLNRDEEPRLQPWEADAGLRQHFEAEYCSVPGDLKDSCSGDIVRAHTIPKSGSLRRIAVDGHVYSFVPTLQNIAKSQGVLSPELRGINRASTFTGFCAHHDKEIFAPVEDAPISFSLEQCFLLAYRAIARENFCKQAQRRSMDMLRDADRGLDIEDQIAVQLFASEAEYGVGIGANDVERNKSLYDEVLLSRDFSVVRSYVMMFDRVPPAMCSGGISPYESFDGTAAQDFADLTRPADAIYFTSFAAGDVGAVVFTWLWDADDTCAHFIESLERVADADLSHALVRFFFEYCENLQIAPDWWDGLGQPVQDALVTRLSRAADPTAERDMNCLLDDGLPLDDWGVRDRYRVP